MAVTNEFLTERYINRGMRDADGNIYVFNNGEYFMASTDAEAMAALDGGGVAISLVYTNESHGVLVVQKMLQILLLQEQKQKILLQQLIVIYLKVLEMSLLNNI